VTRRDAPEIRWRAVLAGGAVAFGAALLLFYLLGSGLSAVAAAGAVAAGSLVAGRLARAGGPLHGGLVAVFWIVAEALSDPLLMSSPDVAGDTARTVLADALTLAIGVGAGWVGSRLR
jgi:hypothetical protein